LARVRTRTWKFESLYRPPRNHFASRCGLFWWVSTGTSTCVQMQEFLTLRNMKAELPKLMKSQYFQNVGDELPFFDSYSFISSEGIFRKGLGRRIAKYGRELCAPPLEPWPSWQPPRARRPLPRSPASWVARPRSAARRSHPRSPSSLPPGMCRERPFRWTSTPGLSLLPASLPWAWLFRTR
jgi:hypothetical protein